MPEVIFPDKVLEIGERQLEVLQGKGIVTRTRNGEGWQGTDTVAALQAMIEAPDSFVCDFCGDGNAIYEYPTEDFVMATVKGSITTTHNSISSWVACQTCATMIEEDEWESLARRAAKRSLLKTRDEVPKGKEELVLALTEELAGGLHQKFKQHWSGKRRRIGFE
jgi:hypothetical protein